MPCCDSGTQALSKLWFIQPLKRCFKFYCLLEWPGRLNTYLGSTLSFWFNRSAVGSVLKICISHKIPSDGDGAVAVMGTILYYPCPRAEVESHCSRVLVFFAFNWWREKHHITEGFRLNPGNNIHCFCPTSVDLNWVTWPHSTAREAGQ